MYHLRLFVWFCGSWLGRANKCIHLAKNRIVAMWPGQEETLVWGKGSADFLFLIVFYVFYCAVGSNWLMAKLMPKKFNKINFF